MATDDEKREHGRQLIAAMGDMRRDRVADATGKDVKTVTNWRKGKTMPDDTARAILRAMFPGYDDKGDPVELAITRSALTEDRKLDVRGYYLRRLREQQEEGARHGA